MNEIWKDINGYDGIYQVSSLGRIKRVASHKRQELIRKPKVLQSKRNKIKYFQITLSKNGCLQTFSVHLGV